MPQEQGIDLMSVEGGEQEEGRIAQRGLLGIAQTMQLAEGEGGAEQRDHPDDGSPEGRGEPRDQKIKGERPDEPQAARRIVKAPSQKQQHLVRPGQARPLCVQNDVLHDKGHSRPDQKDMKEQHHTARQQFPPRSAKDGS